MVCLANSRGGTLILGIADRERTRREAIQGVGPEDPAHLRRAIYDGTDPHILVEIDELVEPEGRLLVIHVPRGVPPHTTTEGVGKIRVGKECKPLTGSGWSQLLAAGDRADMTAVVVPQATAADLDEEQIRLLQQTIETDGGKPDLARRPRGEILANLGLVHGGDVTLAAILLLGSPPALARWAPQHEVTFVRYKHATRYDVRHDLKGPLLAVLEALKRILESNMTLVSLEVGGFAELTIPDMTWWAAREAVLNALVHRDYFLRQSVLIEAFPARLQVTSPGGFIGGVSPDNVLRHPPVRRNALLAGALQAAGVVNRVGLGVDRIYEELLRVGKGLPRYEADEGHVKLILPTRTHQPFARFMAQQARTGRRFELDELILLWAVTERGQLDRWSAARHLQLVEDEASSCLVSLREQGYLDPHGRGRATVYRLARQFSNLLRGPGETDRDLPLDHEAVALRVQAELAERGHLTNAEVRRISGFSRTQALRLMKQLVVAEMAVPRGRGRGAHYAPGPRLPRPAGAKRRGGK